MAKIYANENFRRQVIEVLEKLGHDVLTTFKAGRANLKIPDEEVLEFAKETGRIVLTFNRKHFIRLHRQNPNHPGIIVCTEDSDFEALAGRIHEVIEKSSEALENQLIRINRPNPGPAKT